MSGSKLKEKVVLVLQGGGALGAYQAGAYAALHEAGYEAQWMAGISIGSINSALIAGNPPEKRVEKLREFALLNNSSLSSRVISDHDLAPFLSSRNVVFTNP